MPVEIIHLISYQLAKLRDIFTDAMVTSGGREATVEIEGVGFVTFSPLITEGDGEAPLHGELATATSSEEEPIEPEPAPAQQPKPKKGIVSVAPAEAEANG